MILQGDCRERMAEMEESSIDAIVCDPPYELGFMGKKWDGSGIAYDQEVWRQAWRVLKPGGYLLAFGGTRTYHRLACAIEDAGFILHPMIGWCFGSGFPKATNLSKMLDKDNGRHSEYDNFGAYLRERRLDLGLTQSEIDRALGTNTAYSWWEGRASGVQPPRKSYYLALKDILGLDDRYDEFIERIEAEREVIGKHPNPASEIYRGGKLDKDIDITAPATDAARQWDGWYYGRQSMKPALEPICVAQKPPEGRMVDNVLRWGCGAVNVDGCRVKANDFDPKERVGATKLMEERPWNRDQLSSGERATIIEGNSLGRWPANLILGHAPGCVRRGEKRVRGVQKAAGSPGFGSDRDDNYELGTGREYGPDETVADWDCVEGCAVRLIESQSEGASRFFYQVYGVKNNIDPDPLFYCAKVSRAERNRGLEGMPTREAKTTEGLNSPEMRAARGRQAKETTRQNHHPTVKPLKLMRYLVRLVTPPGGTVLDPFAGSGTTLVAAKEEGFRYIGIELEPEYVEIAEARLAAADRPPATLEDFAP